MMRWEVAFRRLSPDTFLAVIAFILMSLTPLGKVFCKMRFLRSRIEDSGVPAHHGLFVR